MSLNMGGSKQSNSSDASSISASTSSGFNTAESGDSSLSTSTGMSQTRQGIAFEDIFKQLFEGASGAQGRAALNAPQLATAAQQLFTGGTDFLKNLGGDAGTDYLEGRLTGENTALEDAIASLRTDAESMFTDELNPQIVSNAVAGGTLGGGRQGVAEGIVKSNLLKDFTSKAAQLRYQDVNSRDSIAGEIAKNSLAGAGMGLESLPGLLDLNERGANAELGSYSALSQILGGPTVLSQSDSSQNARSIAEAFSRSFGEQSSESSSSSTARSRGKGRSYNFGFGLGDS